MGRWQVWLGLKVTGLWAAGEGDVGVGADCSGWGTQ